MAITTTIVLYSIAWLLLIHYVRQKKSSPSKLLHALVAAGLITHGYAVYGQIILPEGYSFDFFRISSLFFWVTNLLILVSSLRLPLHNLFLITLPITVLAMLTSLFSATSNVVPRVNLSLGVASHIFLSIVAYSTMIIATVQALLLAFQNYRIRHKHPTGLAGLLPPLQTMETLLFEILWTGEVLLTLVIITGFIHMRDIAEQHLHHKIVFTAVAWVIYGILLWGRHFLGWRGNQAIRWALAGFASLILAYWGTKLVMEILLGSA